MTVVSDFRARCYAIIPAAGIGARFGAGHPKQYSRLGELAILDHTLSQFLDCERIVQVLVPLAAEDDYWSTLQFSRHEKIRTCTGGATRAESVSAGLQVLQQSAQIGDWVLVHDAARPCITTAAIDELIATLDDEEVGGLFAAPATDTVKLSDRDNTRVDRSLSRDRIWLAQTPQMFRYPLLQQCLDLAREDGIEMTDEASAVEHAGHQPRLVRGPHDNIKVTAATDAALAAFFLDTQIKDGRRKPVSQQGDFICE